MTDAHTLQVHLTYAHDLALDLTTDLARDGRDRAVADDLVREIDRARAVASALSRLRGDVFFVLSTDVFEPLTRAFELAHRLHYSPDLCQVLAHAVVSARDLVPPVEDARLPSAMSCRLTRWAARLLPLAARLEYAEVFQSELCDLARSGTSRWTQGRHALRVLVRAPVLRQELRVPARERSW